MCLDQKVVFCPLSKVQEEIYKTLLQTNDVQLVLRQSEPCDCRSELTRGKCCYTVCCNMRWTTCYLGAIYGIGQWAIPLLDKLLN